MGEGLGWGWFDASGASPRHVAVTWSEPGGKLSFLDFPMLHCHMQPVAEHSALSVLPGRVRNLSVPPGLTSISHYYLNKFCA